MAAASKPQETVVDTQKFELDALSDDQLDAVSGGDIRNQNAAAAAQRAEQDKQAAAAAATFQQLLAQ